VVELLLQLAHLLKERVGVVGGHLLGDLVVPLEQRLGLRHAFLDIAKHGLGVVKLGFLVEHSHGEARHQPGIAVRRLLDARHHPQQRGLASAVGAEDADLRAGQERESHVVEDDLVAVRLPHSAHLVDELGHASKGRGSGCPVRTVGAITGPVDGRCRDWAGRRPVPGSGR